MTDEMQNNLMSSFGQNCKLSYFHSIIQGITTCLFDARFVWSVQHPRLNVLWHKVVSIFQLVEMP